MRRRLAGYVLLSLISLVVGAVLGVTWARTSGDASRGAQAGEADEAKANAAKEAEAKANEAKEAKAAKQAKANAAKEAKEAKAKEAEEPGGDSSGGEADGGGDDGKAKTAATHTCNICGSTGKFGRFAGRTASVCPVCKSKERHRLLMHYLEHGTTMFREKLDVLHFSPEQAEEAVMRRQPKLHYVTADFLHEEDLRLDLTAIDQPNNAWDVVIVYHILEHIVDDEKAMREIFRILRPGGRAVLQVPIEVGRTLIYEDSSIVDPKQRTKHFGQKDHVRRYSAQGFQERLEHAGFKVEPVDYIAKLDPELVKKHRLAGAFGKPQDERIWIVRKPKKRSRRGK